MAWHILRFYNAFFANLTTHKTNHKTSASHEMSNVMPNIYLLTKEKIMYNKTIYDVCTHRQNNSTK